jgi:hypothetical protein
MQTIGFYWHFMPGKWVVVPPDVSAIETCDGCPYSDVDAGLSKDMSLLWQPILKIQFH